MPPLGEMESLFKGSLLDCFKDLSHPTPLVQQPGPRDDWADVSVDTATGTPVVDENADSKPSSRDVKHYVDTLPSIEMLARPDELLLKPPYHLTITQTDFTSIEVQGSHSPTLQLLADYLQKWCKTNHQDSRNVRSHRLSPL